MIHGSQIRSSKDQNQSSIGGLINDANTNASRDCFTIATDGYGSSIGSIKDVDEEHQQCQQRRRRIGNGSVMRVAWSFPLSFDGINICIYSSVIRNEYMHIIFVDFLVSRIFL